jgi:precorrin-6A/cobalt-precorrin-6A reductase
VLVLGGTGEARELARRLDLCADVDVVSSLAGRIAEPARPEGEVRIGGFGGVEGLHAFIVDRRIGAIVDATHPFAATISRHAFEAASSTGVPLVALRRPPWEPAPGDRWHDVDDADEAARVAPRLGGRIFLSLGRQTLGPFAACAEPWFLIRAIEAPAGPLPPRHELLLARGPFTLDQERALLRDRRIEVVVSKNSGGPATSAKIVAARELALPVVLIRRPEADPAPAVSDVPGVVAWIAAVIEKRSAAR